MAARKLERGVEEGREDYASTQEGHAAQLLWRKGQEQEAGDRDRIQSGRSKK
jgi:hypothetical protein